MEGEAKIVMSLMFFTMAFIFYGITFVAYTAFWVLKRKWIGQLATMLAYLAFAGITMALLMRGFEAKRAPFSNLYESMVLFISALTGFYLYLEYKHKIKVLGSVVMLIAMLSMTAASLLPYKYKSVAPLNPALQNKWHWLVDLLSKWGLEKYALGWLDFHVFVTFMSYGTFAVAFGVSIVYLVKISFEEKGKQNSLVDSLPDSEILDELSYKFIIVGVPLLLIGIVSGAAWANYAWGTYWSWDPKETWSLITWFVYLAYLHARIARGWRGKKTAYFAIAGFLCVVFLYWGVSFIIPGLHAYA